MKSRIIANMFTGIIERTLRVHRVADGPGFRRLSVAADWTDVKHGESIAINGCCLTVAKVTDGELHFDVISETLAKTNIGLLQSGDEVNAERALRVGDRIDGHFVQGHIDGIARLVDIINTANEWRLILETAPPLSRYLIPKGSVAIDGVSLTLASVDVNRFHVALIPTTLELTTLKTRRVGWMFNLEADVFSKTIVSYLERLHLDRLPPK